MADNPALNIDPIVVSDESTVVSQYEAEPQREENYQSEAQLERSFIEQLERQAYEYLPVHHERELIANLRTQLEALNGITFSDTEWERFFTQNLAGENEGIVEKTRRIQEDHVQVLIRDDGSSKNIALIDKRNIHRNRLQVINQYAISQAEGAAKSNRYDVTILVNGLPLVHVELKRRGVPIREAFNQINRYGRDSFWAGSGLFNYVQIFLISNGTHTKYYSNTTRARHVRNAQDAERTGRGAGAKRTSNTFEFTSWWADATNRPIADLVDFTKTFLAKHALLNILTRYCVFTSEELLLVMRPYQIVATERILQRVQISSNYKTWGSVEGGGYVWHTTGSGKTLTSFKTAQLASAMPGIDKVLFVVDRKDLDYQTMREYDRFCKGAANSNTSTAVLKQQMEDPSAKIIITTIQKLDRFIKANTGHAVFDGHVVIIFDECHRSQFGDMHTSIKRAFKRYHLFGFTGTPIFAENAGTSGKPTLRTTEQAFGEKLHTYTIVDAITDGNVLPFRMDYISTIREGDVEDKEVNGIDTAAAMHDPRRLRMVTEYIIDHYQQKTKGQFNAIFATDSIPTAQAYYQQFKTVQAKLPEERHLKVGIIYSSVPGGGESGTQTDGMQADGTLAEESFATDQLSASDQDFLSAAVCDYNQMFSTNFQTRGDSFENYYKDLCARVRSRELDLVIVVNMLLTGFDATTLNTLFVDKNLRSHGLIQAYSRTNRILNSVKSYGNVVCFRDLQQQTNDAIALFGNKDARGTVVLKPYREYYQDYSSYVSELLESYPPGEQIQGEDRKKQFIRLFGAILRVTNILSAFDDFTGNELLTPRQTQDYQSTYLDLRDEIIRPGEADNKEDITQDVLFEIELIKQVQVNVDYILMMVKRYQQAQGSNEDKEIRADLLRSVDASPSLRNKKDLVEEFINRVSPHDDVDTQWCSFITQALNDELNLIIQEEDLNPNGTHTFMARAFEEGSVPGYGTAITKILPRLSLFTQKGGHSERKSRVLTKLNRVFQRFQGLLPGANPNV